jgi:MFS transporter
LPRRSRPANHCRPYPARKNELRAAASVCRRRRGEQLRHADRRACLPGAFGAFLAPAALSLLSTTFSDPKERGKAFGIYGAIAGGGGAVGLVLGGALTE